MISFYLRVTPSDSVKIIISVSKKVSKSAVIRNTVKRRLRPIIKKFSLKPAKYILIAKPGADKIMGKKLEGELRSLFKL